MKLFRRNKLSRKKQDKTNRNVKAFHILTTIGFTPPEARRMLIAGNNINIKRLSAGSPVTAPTIFAAAYGKRKNPDGQAILSEALKIPVEDLFPENKEAVNA